MFNFLKKKEENPVAAVFSGLSSNQKMSVMNLLLSIAVCDRAQGNDAKEMQYLNSYLKILDVRSDRCMAYLETGGQERIISDLKPLSLSQKEVLIVAAFEMITCDGSPNDTELGFAGDIFEKLGIDPDKFVETIHKTQVIMKKFKRQ